MIPIGKAICRRRGECRLTQAQLAMDAGVHERHLQEFEAGRRQPTLDVLFKLAPHLRTSVRGLVEMAEGMEVLQ